MDFLSTLQKKAERRVVGFIVAVVAQRLQVLFELGLGLRQLESRQHPAEVGAVAAVVKQRNVPVGAQRLQEFQQRARRLRELEAVQPLAQRLRRRPPTI